MQWEGYTFDDSNGDGVGDVGHGLGPLGPLGPLYETNEVLKDPNVTGILNDIQEGMDNPTMIWAMPDDGFDLIDPD